MVLHICSPNLLCKKNPITFCPSKAVLVVRVLWQPLPEAKLRGISCTGLGELAECGWELGAPFPHLPGQGAGVHSLCSKLRSVEMLLPCLSPASDVFLLLLAFLTHFFPLQAFWFFIVLLTQTEPTALFAFFFQISLLENIPYVHSLWSRNWVCAKSCRVAAKDGVTPVTLVPVVAGTRQPAQPQSALLSQPSPLWNVMEQCGGGGHCGHHGAGDGGGQLQIPLLIPPPLKPDSISEHLFIVLPESWEKYSKTHQHCPEPHIHFL